MSSLLEFFEVVAAEWRARRVPLLPPVAEPELAKLFADLGCPLSADVRDLYTTVGGFADGAEDEMWTLWSPRLIRDENESEHRPFVMFADYLLGSHVYCFRYETAERSSVYISYDGRSLEREAIATSVAEFFEKLLCSPGEVDAWRI